MTLPRSGTGMFLGKFMPPHLGHLYLGEFAQQYVADLAVVVGTLASEPIPGELRYAWMRELFPNARVIHLTDENPQYPHEHPDFWAIWQASLQRVLPWRPDYVGRVQAGQSVLVVGASGGVGSYAVQLAKAFGAEVTGVCSAAKADLVASLGADHVIDYTRDDFAAGSRRYDLVLDIAGNPSLKRLRRALRPRGTAVFVGGENAGVLIGMGRQLRGVLLSVFVRQRLALLTAKERASDYESLTDLIEAGQLVPSIDRTYPLEDAPLAVRQLEAGHVRGKVAITVDR